MIVFPYPPLVGPPGLEPGVSSSQSWRPSIGLWPVELPSANHHVIRSSDTPDILLHDGSIARSKQALNPGSLGSSGEVRTHNLLVNGQALLPHELPRIAGATGQNRTDVSTIPQSRSAVELRRLEPLLRVELRSTAYEAVALPVELQRHCRRVAEAAGVEPDACFST